MHSYVANVENSWKINIHLFSHFSHQLFINRTFGVALYYGACHRTIVMRLLKHK